MHISQRTKGILVLIGGCLMHIISGTVHVWSALNVYVISYLYNNKNTNIKLDHGFFIGPFGVFAISLFMSLGGYLEKNYGPRKVLPIGISLVLLGHIIVLFSKNVVLDYFAVFIMGSGVGCNYCIPMRLGYKYFPKNRGIVVGTVQIGLAITATFLSQIAEKIINPHAKNPSIVIGDDKFFDKDVSNRIRLYIIIMCCVIVVFGGISIFFFFPYENEEENINSINILINNDNPKKISPDDDKDNNDNIDNNDNFENNCNNDKNKDLINQNIPVKDTKEVYYPIEEVEYKTLKQSFCSKYFLFFILMAFCSNIFPPLLSNTFRPRGQNYNYSTKHLKWLASGFSGFNSFGRPLWGYLYDKIGFKKLFLFGNGVIIIIGCTIYFTIKIKVLFSILMIITGFMMGIFYSIIPAYVSIIFGIKLSSEVYGVVFIGNGLANMLGPVFFFIIKKVFILKKKKDQFEKSLEIAYFIGAGFALISFIICLLTPKEKKKIKGQQNNFNEQNKEK